jgi:hypothetical protein
MGLRAELDGGKHVLDRGRRAAGMQRDAKPRHAQAIGHGHPGKDVGALEFAHNAVVGEGMRGLVPQRPASKPHVTLIGPQRAAHDIEQRALACAVGSNHTDKLALADREGDLFAFGYLFGFVGLLIAVPLASAIGVLTRFALQRYYESFLYTAIPRATVTDAVRLTPSDKKMD